MFKEKYNEILQLFWIPQFLALYFHFCLAKPRNPDPSSSLKKRACHLEVFTFKDFGVFAADSTVIWEDKEK
jgi:hypothetical protein